MSSPLPESPLSPAAEDALLERLLARMREMARTSGSPDGPDARVEPRKDSSNPADLEDSMGPAAEDHPADTAAISAALVPRIGAGRGLGDIIKETIEARKKHGPPVQLLFRVPEELRDAVKRLSVDRRRAMDELLIEAVLDLLNKYGRPWSPSKHGGPSADP